MKTGLGQGCGCSWFRISFARSKRLYTFLPRLCPDGQSLEFKNQNVKFRISNCYGSTLARRRVTSVDKCITSFRSLIIVLFLLFSHSSYGQVTKGQFGHSPPFQCDAPVAEWPHLASTQSVDSPLLRVGYIIPSLCSPYPHLMSNIRL